MAAPALFNEFVTVMSNLAAEGLPLGERTMRLTADAKGAPEDLPADVDRAALSAEDRSRETRNVVDIISLLDPARVVELRRSAERILDEQIVDRQGAALGSASATDSHRDNGDAIIAILDWSRRVVRTRWGRDVTDFFFKGSRHWEFDDNEAYAMLTAFVWSTSPAARVELLDVFGSYRDSLVEFCKELIAEGASDVDVAHAHAMLAATPSGAAAVATPTVEQPRRRDGATADLSAEELLVLAAALTAPLEPSSRLSWWGPEQILERLFTVVWKLCPEFDDEEAARAFALRFMSSVTTLPGGLDGVRRLLADEMRDKSEFDAENEDSAEQPPAGRAMSATTPVSNPVDEIVAAMRETVKPWPAADGGGRWTSPHQLAEELHYMVWDLCPQRGDEAAEMAFAEMLARFIADDLGGLALLRVFVRRDREQRESTREADRAKVARVAAVAVP